MQELKDYLANNPKKHLIFDFDETLAWLVLPWEIVFEDIRDDLIAIDPDLYREYDNGVLGWSQIQNAYIADHGDEAKKVILDYNINFETKKLERVDLNKELIQFVKDTNGYDMTIWSSNTTEAIMPVLKEQGIADKFRTIVTRNTVNYLKPDIDGFQYIRDEDDPISSYLFIGDSMADQEVSLQLGMDFIQIDFFK